MADAENNTREQSDDRKKRAAAEYAAERLKVLQKKASEDAEKARKDADELLKRAQRNYREEAAAKPQYTDWDTPQQAEPTTATTQQRPKLNQTTISNPTTEYYPSTSTRFKTDQQQRKTDPRHEPDEKTIEKKQQKQQQAQQRAEEGFLQRQQQRLNRQVQRQTLKSRRQILKKARKGLHPAQKASLRARAKAVTYIGSIVIGIFYTVHFWAAITWYTATGLGVAFDASLLARIADLGIEVLTGVLSLFNLTEMQSGQEIMLAIAVITQGVILIQGLLLVSLISFMFMIAGIHAFSGRFASFKWILFTITIIGYVVPIPIINLVPWIYLWMFFVSWYPR